MNNPIHIQTTVNAPIETVWSNYTEPEQITHWAFASDDWECPAAKNDLRVGGRFATTMAAKDGSMQFDVTGEYTSVVPHELIEYTMDDGRNVSVTFSPQADGVLVKNSLPAIVL